MQFRVLGRKSKLGLAATFAIGAGWYTNRRYKRVESPSSEATTETSVEESLVSEQVAHGPTKQPVLFQWSSLPKFIERRYAPDWEGNGIAWKAASTVVIGSVGLISKFFLKYLAHTQVYNLDKFMALADQDGRGRALITGKAVSFTSSLQSSPFSLTNVFVQCPITNLFWMIRYYGVYCLWKHYFRSTRCAGFLVRRTFALQRCKNRSL